MKRIILSLALAATMLSCAKEQEAIQTPDPYGSERVCASAADFICGNELTKTVITQESTDAPKFAWKEDDVIGVIPMNNETVQSNYKISEISSDSKEAMFDGGVWALKEGKEYAAYYPFKKEALLSNESIEFSFLGQTQSANNSLAHLGAYDYMYASSVIPTEGVANFKFKHLISLVRLQLTVPTTDTYTKVVLESSVSWFARGASLKLSDGTATATEADKSATINLNNIAITAGSVLTVWLATLPTNALSAQTLSVKLFGNENTCTGEVTGITTLAVGSAYSYAATLSSEGPEVEYVDLGLSVKWATCNLGAANIEEYGEYYAWGETETKSKYSTATYKFYKSEIVSEGGFDKNYSGYTKYIPQSEADSYGLRGFYDDKLVLDPEDDVAHVKLGGKWRMPTSAEIDELINNCQRDWVAYKGINGIKFTSIKTGYTDKWIFFPAPGYWYNDYNLTNVGSRGYYWSLSLNTNRPSCAYGLSVSSDFNSGYSGSREGGASIRPVLVDTSTHIHSLTKINGQGPTATSSGWKGYYKCSDYFCGKCFEDAEGTVSIGDKTALAAWKAEGGRGYLAPVTVTEPELVDLGLSVKWAAWNLGATKPEEYGGYYQWAGLGDVTDTSIYIDWSNCPYHTGSSYSTGWTKYVPSGQSSYWSGTGSPDNKTVLDPEDDIAHVTLGGSWRMPTDAEWTELRTNCTWTWSRNYNGTGIAGRIVTSNKSGYTDKSIFLPAAGDRFYDYLGYVGSSGYYWSSALRTDFPYCAYYVVFGSDNVGRDDYSRYRGQSVRPVLE